MVSVSASLDVAGRNRGHRHWEVVLRGCHLELLWLVDTLGRESCSDEGIKVEAVEGYVGAAKVPRVEELLGADRQLLPADRRLKLPDRLGRLHGRQHPSPEHPCAGQKDERVGLVLEWRISETRVLPEAVEAGLDVDLVRGGLCTEAMISGLRKDNHVTIAMTVPPGQAEEIIALNFGLCTVDQLCTIS